MPPGYGQPKAQSRARARKKNPNGTSYKAVAPPSNTGLGAMLGNMIEPGIGGLLGGAAESLFTSLIGQGDYADIKQSVPLESNTIMGVQSREAAQVPVMHKEKGFTRVTHREYVGDIGMTVGFSNAQYNITPSNSTLFPWLSTLARNYSEYCIQGLVFEFVSLSANAISGTNAGLGSVTMFVDYDVYASPPANKTQANNAMFAVSGRPTDSNLCPLECEPDVSNQRVLRTGKPGTAASDQHFYVYGNFNIMTQGGANAYPGAGELWVTYDIDLFKPIIGQPPIRALHANIAPTNLNPLALDVKGVRYNTINATLTTTAITFPSTVRVGDAFLIIWTGAGGTITAASTPPVFSSSSFLLSDFQRPGFTGAWKCPLLPFVDKYQCTVLAAVYVTSSVAPTITLGSGVTPGTTLGDFWVLEAPLDMFASVNVSAPAPGVDEKERPQLRVDVEDTPDISTLHLADDLYQTEYQQVLVPVECAPRSSLPRKVR